VFDKVYCLLIEVQCIHRLEGYLVAYEDVRRDVKKPAMLNVDHPWIHLDVRATFYIYKPAVGQVIQGTNGNSLHYPDSF